MHVRSVHIFALVIAFIILLPLVFLTADGFDTAAIDGDAFFFSGESLN